MTSETTRFRLRGEVIFTTQTETVATRFCSKSPFLFDIMNMTYDLNMDFLFPRNDAPPQADIARTLEIICTEHVELDLEFIPRFVWVVFDNTIMSGTPNVIIRDNIAAVESVPPRCSIHIIGGFDNTDDVPPNLFCKDTNIWTLPQNVRCIDFNGIDPTGTVDFQSLSRLASVDISGTKNVRSLSLPSGLVRLNISCCKCGDVNFTDLKALRFLDAFHNTKLPKRLMLPRTLISIDISLSTLGDLNFSDLRDLRVLRAIRNVRLPKILRVSRFIHTLLLDRSSVTCVNLSLSNVYLEHLSLSNLTLRNATITLPRSLKTLNISGAKCFIRNLSDLTNLETLHMRGHKYRMEYKLPPALKLLGTDATRDAPSLSRACAEGVLY